MSSVPDNSASLIAAGPLNLSQDTLTSGMPSSLGVLLDELLMLHHVELQIANGKLLRQPDFGHLGLRLRGEADKRCRAGERAQGGHTIHVVSSHRPRFLAFGR